MISEIIVTLYVNLTKAQISENLSNWRVSQGLSSEKIESHPNSQALKSIGTFSPCCSRLWALLNWLQIKSKRCLNKRALLEKASESTPELEQLRTENSYLAAELSQATSKLEGLRRLLNGNGDSQTYKAPMATPVPQKVIAQSPQTPQPSPPQDTHPADKPTAFNLYYSRP